MGVGRRKEEKEGGATGCHRQEKSRSRGCCEEEVESQPSREKLKRRPIPDKARRAELRQKRGYYIRLRNSSLSGVPYGQLRYGANPKFRMDPCMKVLKSQVRSLGSLLP